MDLSYPYRIGIRNERGDRLLHFCQEEELTITDTWCKLHPRSLYIWKSPADSAQNIVWNQIDFRLPWSICSLGPCSTDGRYKERLKFRNLQFSNSCQLMGSWYEKKSLYIPLASLCVHVYLYWQLSDMSN